MHHECWKAGPVPCGFDYRENLRPAAVDPENAGIYSAELFPKKVEKVLNAHDFGKDPLFLYYALQNVHWPIEVPEKYLKGLDWVTDPVRRTYYGMVKALDDSVGQVIDLFERNYFHKQTGWSSLKN